MPALMESPRVNIHEAKTNLSRIIKELEEGRKDAYIIARHGKPVARIVPFDIGQTTTRKRIGVAKGKFELKDEHELFYGSYNDEVAQMFEDTL
ncbi:MAG: type II toxin-antitoxin system prevent-host-death family antitoxin [Eggerthellaceae bacterium]|nr:type II toxin-antitoxin system prevent-host-death family antitoxin [Eggerthellaceae bacterium]